MVLIDERLDVFFSSARSFLVLPACLSLWFVLTSVMLLLLYVWCNEHNKSMLKPE
jgi:hypothetical protein